MGRLGALAALMKAMRQEKYVPREEIRQIGKYVKEIPNEEFFRNVKGPVEGKGNIERAYGVKFNPVSKNTVVPNESLYDPDHYPLSVSGYSMGDYLNAEKDFADPKDVDFWSTLPGDLPIYTIDTSNAPGNVNRTYPAIWEQLSGKGNPDPRMSIVDQLTGINEVRRAMHQADAIKRDPFLERTLPLGAQQSGVLNMSPSDLYYGNNLEDTLGSLWLSSAAKGMNRVGLLMGDNSLPVEGIEALHQLSPQGRLDDFFMYGDKYGSTMGENAGIGPGLARRLHLIDAILNESADKINPEIRKGLGYKAGGLVQAHSCSCNKTHK